MHTKTYNACADNRQLAENNLYLHVPTIHAILVQPAGNYSHADLPQQWLKVQGESLIDHFLQRLKK